MPLLPSHLTPQQLQSVVSDNLDYNDVESSRSDGMAKARLCYAALKRLLIVRPAEATAGGTGKGAGYSAVFDIAALQNAHNAVEAWINARSALNGLVSVFGPSYADTTHLQDIPCRRDY